MSDDATASVDHDSLAGCTNPAVVGQALDFGEVHRSSEKPDEVALGVEDWNRYHDGGDAGVAARANHVRVFGSDSPRVEHVFDVVPDAVIDPDAGWRRRGHRTPGQVADVELQHRRLSRVRGGELLVQVRRVEAGVVQAGDTGVVIRRDLRSCALQGRGLIQEIAIDRLGETFRHGLVLLLDALVLGAEQRGEALGAKEDQGADPDHQETDTDIPAQAVDRGAAAIGRRRAHIAVTARSLQLCAVLRYINVSNARLARPAPLAWGDAPTLRLRPMAGLRAKDRSRLAVERLA